MKYTDEQLPACLALLERQLLSNQGGDGWFVGNKVSLLSLSMRNYNGPNILISSSDSELLYIPSEKEIESENNFRRCIS